MQIPRKLIVASVVVGLAAVAGMVLAQSRADEQRPDCPGKIICPQTGEPICRDKCPTVDPDRPDCPGRIICPQTGELVCKDRCPLESKRDSADAGRSAPASCCVNPG